MSLTWSATGLPPGLSLDASTGTISGTPTDTGEYTVLVSVTDGVDTATATLTMNVETVGTWSATGLPAGLTCSEGGIIAGTPTVAGSFSVVIEVVRGTVSDTTTLPMTILEVTAAPVINDPGAQSGTVGVAFSLAMTAADGVLPLTWSVSAGTLPAGLTIDASTGVISGTPTTVETQTVTIQVTDALVRSDTQDVTFTVGAAILDATYVCGELNPGLSGTATIWKWDATSGTFSVDASGTAASFFSGMGLCANGDLVASSQNNTGGINKFWRKPVGGSWGETGVATGYQVYDGFCRFASGRLAFATQTSGTQFLISDDNGASWTNGLLYDPIAYAGEAPYFVHVNANNHAVFGHFINVPAKPIYFLTNSNELDAGSAIGGLPGGAGYNNYGKKVHVFATFGRMIALSTGRLMCFGGGTSGKKFMWNDSDAEDYTAWQTGTHEVATGYPTAVAVGPSDRVAVAHSVTTPTGVDLYEYDVATDTFTSKASCAGAAACYSLFIDDTGILFAACDNGCFVSTDNTWTTMVNKLTGHLCLAFGRSV